LVDYLCKSTEDTEDLGRSLADKIYPGLVIGLNGTLGAGKTVLTRGIARGLGIKGPITSPTYTMITEYTQGRLPLYHMDLYRIHSEEEVELLGVRDLIYGKGVSVIEWFQRVESWLPEDILVINININETGSRTISFNRDL